MIPRCGVQWFNMDAHRAIRQTSGAMKKLGLIVNPIAGMGGRVGLKGTDGDDVYQRALSLGAEPQAPRRAEEALSVIANANQDVVIVTCAGAMGEDAVRCYGLSSILVEGIPQDGPTHHCRRYAAGRT